jgi:hypothetical protein
MGFTMHENYRRLAVFKTLTSVTSVPLAKRVVKKFAFVLRVAPTWGEKT